MFLDLPTLFIVSTCIAGLLGLFLFFAWIQDRNVHALAWWGTAYIWAAWASAYGLRKPRGIRPALLWLSNALLFVACATIWNGARLFYGRKVRPYALAAGAIVWIVACQIPSFAQSDIYRIVLSSLIVSLYTFATAREIWS